MIIPGHISPDAVTGRRYDFHGSLCGGDVLVLAERAGEEVFGLSGTGHSDELLGEHDQRGHRVVSGDCLRVTVKQGAGVGTKELPGNGILTHDLNATLALRHALGEKPRFETVEEHQPRLQGTASRASISCVQLGIPAWTQVPSE